MKERTRDTRDQWEKTIPIGISHYCVSNSHIRRSTGSQTPGHLLSRVKEEPSQLWSNLLLPFRDSSASIPADPGRRCRNVDPLAEEPADKTPPWPRVEVDIVSPLCHGAN